MALVRRMRKRGGSSVPTDSLSDVAFLLIIFFILTTSIRKLTGFRSELPASEQAKTQQAEKTPTIRLQDETISFNDEQVSLATLETRLKALQLDTKTNEAKVVLLEAAPAVKYQLYFQVMAQVSAAGGVVGIVREAEK